MHTAKLNNHTQLCVCQLAALQVEDSAPNFLQEDKHLASVSYQPFQPPGGIIEQYAVLTAATAAG